MLTLLIVCAWVAVIGVIAVLGAFLAWVVSVNEESDGEEVETVLDAGMDEKEGKEDGGD